ncbi:MAG: FmdB family zinc ribbon protein [Dehalococcoidales bacterium]
MPKNNYKCSQCGEKFDYSKGLFERETNIKCPKCGSLIKARRAEFHVLARG